ncbi:MAG TPA: aryl-sulfate sulfotransferase, partial [Ardenticatenaceae bacterium]|nr:aryl-sulfate sulfotransferase [Ardenticatenaceae bacterium]
MIFRLALALTVLLATFSTPAATRAQLPFAYLSPRPDARFVSTSTTIVVRSAHVLQPRTIAATTFSVAGSASGIHTGHVSLARDGRTVIFAPERPFLAGERVHVTIRPGMRTAAGDALEGMEWRFRTSASTCAAPSRGPSGWRQGCAGPRPDRLTERAGAPAVPNSAPLAARAPAYATVPHDFPTITTTLLSPEVADGSLFLANFTWATTDTKPYLLILDNSGQPVYYKRFTPGTIVADFRKQPNGLLTYYDGEAGLYRAMDRTYTVVDSYQTGNGYQTDLHDLQLLPNGHALLMSYDPQTVDMSRIVPGGHPTATVIGLIIQELDTAKNVVFEWRSWDHFAITDTVAALTTETVDYVHGNAVELDSDGNLLLSSRHLNEITKINRETGDVIWRWGGKRNQFVFSNDEPFVYQHDVRRLPNGNITLFDNRTLETPEYSRAVEYHLDEERKVVTLVREYRNTPDTYSQAMGNAQR